MERAFFIQLVGVLITLAGMVALAASARLFGTPLTDEESQRHGTSGDAYHLAFNWITLASAAVFLGGIGILWWSKFEMCSFLHYWIPNLPEALRLLVSCR